MDAEKYRNYVRLSVLFLNYGRDILQEVLRFRMPFEELKTQLTVNKKRHLKELNFSQRHTLFPKHGLSKGVYDELDLSLISLLLKTFLKSGSNHECLLKSINTLMLEKEKLFGNPKCIYIDKEAFIDSWDTAKQALVAIGTGCVSKEDIERQINKIHDMHVQSTLTDTGSLETLKSCKEHRKLSTGTSYDWTEGKARFIQISELMFICSALLRSLLIKRVSLRELADKVFRQRHIISNFKPFQKTRLLKMAKEADTKENQAQWYTDLDLSCLYLLLRHWGNIPKHANDWGKPPEEKDFSLAADLDRLYGVRYKILHDSRGTDINIENFEDLKQQLFPVIKRLIRLIDTDTLEENITVMMGNELFSECTELKQNQQKTMAGSEAHSTSCPPPDTCSSMNENAGTEKQDDHSSLTYIEKKKIVLESFKIQHRDKLTKAFLGHYCGKPDNVFIVAYLKQTVTQSKYCSTFENVDVLNIDCRFVGPEAAEVMYSKESTENKIRFQDIEKMETLIKENSDSLMKKHTNLEMISGSSVRSTGGQILVETCIVFYCRTKGVVPLGEENFPRTLGEYTIDVREGLFHWAPGDTLLQSPDGVHNPLKMGCNIGLKGENWRGSLGGFVDTEDGLGFITCAHVLYNQETLQHDSNPKDSDYVVQPAGDDEQAICGKVKKYVFDPTGAVGIDAALVEIMRGVPDQGMFTGLSQNNMSFAGFNQPPRYNNGRIRKLRENDMDRRVIKSGAATNLTRGVFRFRGASINVFDTLLYLDSRPLDQQSPFSMKGQIEISGLFGVVFAQPGDSGSLVFLVEEDQSLTCIGMVEGWTTYYSTIVTPIKDILEKLELDNTQLHQFPDPPKMEVG